MNSNNCFGRILLATDGSPEAEAATNATASMALACTSEVRVVHVWNLEVHKRDGAWDVETYREAEELIGNAVRRLRAMGVDASGEISRSDRNHVAAAIARSAADFKADLVVVGSRGLSDWQSIVQHSVSHGLLGALDAPVLIVRGSQMPLVHRSQNVLLAIAGGDDIEPAVRAAAAAATAPGSKVTVLHVAIAFVGAQGYAYVETDEDIAATLDKAVAMLTKAGVEAETIVAEPAAVSRVVAETAARQGADIIVIGSSRMGDLQSMIFGSVTHQVLRTSDKPVLVAGRMRP